MKRDKVSPRAVPRRSFLAGLTSAGLALPLLAGRRALAAPPKRFLVLFSPNGTILDAWRPKGAGKDFTLSPILAPLEKWKSQLLILDGIVHESARNGPGDDHMRGMGHWLTATELLTGDMKGAGLAGGPSIDQVVAARIGTANKFRSLELGMFNELKGQWAVLTRMVFAGANQPLPPTDDPEAMFARLFGGGAPAGGGGATGATPELERLRLLRKSVLDHVAKDLETLQGQLGADDRGRVAQHLQSLREAEKRLVPNPISAPSPSAVCKAPSGVTKLNLRDHANHRTVSRLQADMITMAFACDLTRVASLQWNRASGQAQFPSLGITTGHHDISHLGDNDTVAVDQLTRINTWYAEEVAYLLDKLATTKEPDGSSLLDNTLVMWGNELCKGNSHSHVPAVPYVLAGGGAGFTMGRYLKFAQPRTHNDLYVNIQNAFGIEAQTFGNPKYCKGPIAELA